MESHGLNKIKKVRKPGKLRWSFSSFSSSKSGLVLSLEGWGLICSNGFKGAWNCAPSLYAKYKANFGEQGQVEVVNLYYLNLIIMYLF